MIRPGDKIGKFVVTRHLGAGGMGTVFEARDPELSRSVAIKFVLDADADPIRLLREAQALARISHPNVVTVYEIDSHAGDVFVAMELIDGVTIDRYITANKCNWRAILALYMQAGRGLAAVHAEGLVHRDVKPPNILVDREGRAYLSDFGLARRDEVEVITSDGKAREKPTARVTIDDPAARSHDSRPGPPLDGAALDAQITKHGALVGTPRYMAPEQLEGRRATRASDQFSFAVALWEAVYGELPGTETREAPAGAAAPAWVERTLARALDRDPARRWPSMAALLDELERAPRRRARIMIGAAAAAAIGASVAVLVGVGAFDGKKVDCERAGDPVASAWTAETRSRTAAATAESVAAAIDRWAERARSARIEACRATHERGNQTAELLDKRVACLDGQQVVLDAFVRALARADHVNAENALDAVERIPAPETCTSSRLVSGTSPWTGMMTDPLAEATVALELQRPDAHRLIEQLVVATDGLDPSIRSRAYLLKGRSIGTRDPVGSRVSLEVALAEAAASRDPVLEAEVVLWMLRISAFDSSGRSDALLPMARAAVTRAGDPRPLAFELARAEFEVHSRLRRLGPARAACTRRVELSEPADSVLEAALCRCKLELAADDRNAASSCDDALQLLRKAVGDTHPRTLETARDWVFALVHTRNFEKAETVAQTTVDVTTSVWGQSSVQVVAMLRLLSSTQDLAGKVTESRATLEEALAILDRVDPTSAARVDLLLELSDRAATLRDTKAAIEYADAGLAAAERLLGTDDSKFATALVYRAKATALDPAKLLSARDLWLRAISAAEQTAGQQSFTVASVLSSYALFVASNESLPISDAIDAEMRAVAIFDVLGEKLLVARAEAVTGKLYLMAKNKPEARVWLTRGRDHFAALGDAHEVELANTQRLLATAQ